MYSDDGLALLSISHYLASVQWVAVFLVVYRDSIFLSGEQISISVLVLMENVPVEVIGNILSLLGGVRDVIIASATCRKWREARRKHLQTLSFNSNECPMYRDLTTRLLEILITQTIFQTTGLQGLSILMDEADEFSASTVIAWLMYTRENLRRLFYDVHTNPSINILEICGRQKLEMLFLAHNSIIGVEPSFQRFPCLKSLSLSS